MEALHREIQNDDRKLFGAIEGYWDARSHEFSRTRLKELAGPSAAAWTGVLQERLGKLPRKRLRILDVGTGAGFFAILLSKLGHEVTGIDMSGDMLHEAKLNALACGAGAKFLKMNAQEPDFPDGTFDVVVSRNLTWTLPDAMEAYRQWKRVLKSGGLLMNFDSDYGRETFSRKEDQSDVHANIGQSLIDECNAIKDAVRISTHRRPAWDAAFLRELGMEVELEEDIAPRVHNDPAMHYDNIPLFAICAYNK
ncbi:MAG: class I SAM-dependent methyltransferase [Selenomonadaceae bacterium]|nr:class I SAM-dependent methyltransferase [Selenomonadaceae bacterium]MBQ3971056.1 class I SAM-dependent methyltransferase [Selenomonadaceae bacterium]